MDLNDILLSLAHRVKELERRDRTAKRTGKIAEVDAAKGLARVELMAKGFGGKPVLSAWIPWAEQAAGAAKTHFPPSVGQQVEVSSENGDMTDGIIHMSIPSNSNKRPSSHGDEFVLIDSGGVRVSAQGGKLHITCDNFDVTASSQTTLASDKVQINGSELRHNDKDIGHTHIHGGVEPGGATTDVPAN